MCLYILGAFPPVHILEFLKYVYIISIIILLNLQSDYIRIEFIYLKLIRSNKSYYDKCTNKCTV